MKGVKKSPDEPIDAVALVSVTLHNVITWPGVPKVADNTLHVGKVPGLKMYLVDDSKFLHMTCEEKHIDVPISGVKCFIREQALGL